MSNNTNGTRAKKVTACADCIIYGYIRIFLNGYSIRKFKTMKQAEEWLERKDSDESYDIADIYLVHPTRDEEFWRDARFDSVSLDLEYYQKPNIENI